jgi:hypothetical protein
VKDGHLVFKDGHLVFTDDPSTCACCGSATCCGGCSNVPSSITVEISGVTNTLACCDNWNGTFVVPQCGAASQSGSTTGCAYALDITPSCNPTPGSFGWVILVFLGYSGGTVYAEVILSTTNGGGPGICGDTAGADSVFNGSFAGVDCIGISGQSLPFNAGLSNTGAFLCGFDASGATVTITSNDDSAKVCLSCCSTCPNVPPSLTVDISGFTNTVGCCDNWNGTYTVPQCPSFYQGSTACQYQLNFVPPCTPVPGFTPWCIMVLLEWSSGVLMIEVDLSMTATSPCGYLTDHQTIYSSTFDATDCIGIVDQVIAFVPGSQTSSGPFDCGADGSAAVVKVSSNDAGALSC